MLDFLLSFETIIRMKLSPLSLFLYTLFAAVLLYIVENIVHPTYGYLLIFKVTLFLLIPLAVGYATRVHFGRFGSWSRDTWKYGIGFGIFSMLIIG